MVPGMPQCLNSMILTLRYTSLMELGAIMMGTRITIVGNKFTVILGRDLFNKHSVLPNLTSIRHILDSVL